jgi:hypothetical protein
MDVEQYMEGYFMIGVLCSDGTERDYAEVFNSLLKKIEARKEEDIIIFTISNIDFIQMKVIGSLVMEKTVERVQVSLPSIIYNLSLQQNMEGIKARKRLEEMNSVKLINDTNRYNQHMIMEILYSSKVTRRYLLPYHIYNKLLRDFKPDDNQPYIAMPSRGASISRIIYAEPTEDSDIVKGTQYFKKGQICDYIDASLCQSQWIFLETPNLMVRGNYPIIVRCYLQKSSHKSWKLLDRKIYPDESVCIGNLIRRTELAALAFIDYICKFLPSIGIAFIDFLLDNEGFPYFLHLGGFEKSFFEQEQRDDMLRKFYKNLFSLASDYRRMQEED